MDGCPATQEQERIAETVRTVLPKKYHLAAQQDDNPAKQGECGWGGRVNGCANSHAAASGASAGLCGGRKRCHMLHDLRRGADVRQSEKASQYPGKDPMLQLASASRDVYESRPEVGSSRKRMRGELMSATPMFVRFACPPANM